MDHSATVVVILTGRADRSGSEPSENGRLATKTASNSSEQATLSAFSCPAAGVCSSDASVGIVRAATASIIKETINRGDSAS